MSVRVVLAGYVLASCVVATGCSKSPSLPASSATEDAGSAARGDAAGVIPHEVACVVDADCTQTCELGAVSAAWLRSFDAGPDCRDGCLRVGRDPPRCEGGRCIAYHMGKRDELCTGRAPSSP